MDDLAATATTLLDDPNTELSPVCEKLLAKLLATSSGDDLAGAEAAMRAALEDSRVERGAVLVRCEVATFGSSPRLGVARLSAPVNLGGDRRRNFSGHDGVLTKFVLVLLAKPVVDADEVAKHSEPHSRPSAGGALRPSGAKLRAGRNMIRSWSRSASPPFARSKRPSGAAAPASTTGAAASSSSAIDRVMRLEDELMALFADDLFLVDAYLADSHQAFVQAMEAHGKRRSSPVAADASCASDASSCTSAPPLSRSPTFVHPHEGLVRSGRLCGGIIDDLKRRLNSRTYASDWRDGLNTKSVAAGLYMFFACLAPGIAFGASVELTTGGRMGVIEYLLSQGITGVVFALLSGQPLIILRPTGPITLFTTSLFLMSRLLQVDFLQLHAWVGIWVGVVMILVAATDLCSLVRFCGRFTQDIFGAFVAVIFISMAVTNILTAFEPSAGGVGAGAGAGRADFDSAFLTLILAVLTFQLAHSLSGMRSSAYLTHTTRERLSEFAVPVAIVCLAACRQLFPSVGVDSLALPASIQLTRGANATLFIPLLGVGPSGGAPAPPWLPLVGLGFGVFLSLLFFVDHNVTSLRTQASEHHLRKGNAYHWNFLLVGLFNITMPLVGCPFVTGSLPHSPQFVQALAIKEIVAVPSADGSGAASASRVVHTHETRVAPLLANVLILGSLVLTPAFAYIPTACLDGLFLFMGISSLPSNAIWQRAKLILQQKRMHPPGHISRSLPLVTVHSYTALQVGMVAFLFLLSRTAAALSFPVFVILTIPLRLALPRLMCRCFSDEALRALDGEPPKAATGTIAPCGDGKPKRSRSRGVPLLWSRGRPGKRRYDPSAQVGVSPESSKSKVSPLPIARAIPPGGERDVWLNGPNGYQGPVKV